MLNTHNLVSSVIGYVKIIARHLYPKDLHEYQVSVRQIETILFDVAHQLNLELFVCFFFLLLFFPNIFDSSLHLHVIYLFK